MPEKIAFIDVQNIEITTLKVLGFAIDHEKLFSFLKNKWGCEKVFFYPGIKHGDTERKNLFEKLTELGAIVRPKHYFAYKNENKILAVICPKYSTQITHKIETGYSWKCNCDVELTMDVIDNANKNSEIFLFSGDGDFESLIKKVIEGGAKVAIVTSAEKIRKGARYYTSRLSTKLRNLTQPNGSPVKFLEIDNLKFQVKK